MHRPHSQQKTHSIPPSSKVKAGVPIPGQIDPRNVQYRDYPYTKPGQPKTTQKKAAKEAAAKICYVLDTNVLIDDPRSPFAFMEHDVVIPLVVFEELDNLKSKLPQARDAIRALYELGLSENWTQLESGGRLRAESGRNISNVPGIEGNNDNRIISIAVGLDQKFGPNNKETGKYRGVVLVSNDLNVGVKSRILGLQTELYKTNEARLLIGGDDDVLQKIPFSHEEIEAMMTHSGGEGWKLSAPTSVRAKLEKAGVLINGAFLVCLDDSRTVQFAAINKGSHLIRTDKNNGLVWNNGVIHPFVPPYWQARGVTNNHEQEAYLHALSEFDTTLVTAYGIAGTGKTLQAVAIGLKLVLEGHYDKLLITKPQVTSGNDIGFLPGKKEEKMASWIAPMRDHIIATLRKLKKQSKRAEHGDPSEVSNPWAGKQHSTRKVTKKDSATPKVDVPSTTSSQKRTTGGAGPTSDSQLFDGLIADGKLEIEATAFVRGRSLERVFVVIDEGQNLSVEEMKTWVTRIGEGSKLVVTGDIEQIDAPYLRKNNNGLAVLAERSRGQGWAFSVHLIYGVRSVMSDWAAQNL